MKGLLWKKARTKATLKPWGLRWFTLEEKILSYHRYKANISGAASSKQHADAHKTIKITKTTRVERQTDSSKKFSFLLIGCLNMYTGNEDTIQLAAVDEEDMIAWMQALRIAADDEPSTSTVDREAPPITPVVLRKAVSRTTLKLANLYDIKERVGQGGFSVVKKGICKQDGKTYALKIIPVSVFEKNKDQTEDEVRVLAALDHPNIVKLKEVVHTPKHFVIVMEFMEGGELFDRIVKKKKYNEHDAKVIAARILDAVRFLHDHDIVHRDIKPENIMFATTDEGSALKLTDFGFATMYNKSHRLTTTCGTPEYVAPEIIMEKEYGSAVDMWSVGVVIYILLCGFPPFFGESEEILFERICGAKYHFVRPFWDNVSKEAKHLIRHLLDLDPEKRYTAQQALEHPWFNDVATGPGMTEPVSTDLFTALNELKRYNAFRKFRKGVLCVLAANKLISSLKGLSYEEPTPRLAAISE